MKVVIIGGVAGGASAAARLRRLDETAEIIILERSGYISYANCGLPYYIGGTITDEEDLTLQDAEGFWSRFRIEARVRNEALSIDPDAKTVSVRRLDTGETYTETYDRLILSPGARPVMPPLPGIDDRRVFTLRTVEDALAIKRFVDEAKPYSAVIIGGGAIGLEMAQNLAERGLGVTLADMAEHILPRFDGDMACIAQGYLAEAGIDLRLNSAVAGFADTAEGLSVRFADGSSISTDLVIMSAGVQPDTALAKSAGIELGPRGAIITDSRMRTSVPDIYAVGDAVMVKELVTGTPANIALAGPANKQGRIAADNICGRDSEFSGAQGSSIIKLFKLTAANTGLGETDAERAGIAYDSVVLFPASHATYYPDSTNMTMKVVFSPEDGRILGAQIIGFDGVDKRIDVLASAVRAGMKASDLCELELAYAPPYSSAKDPVNMAGFMIENILTGVVKQVGWSSVLPLDTDKVTLLDARTEEEWDEDGHIEGAVNIPVDSLRDRIGELDRAKPLYVYCFSGLRSYIACRILAQNGFDCYNIAGGWHFYDAVTSGGFDFASTHPCGVKKN